MWTISVLRHFDSGALGTVLKYHKRLWEFKKNASCYNTECYPDITVNGQTDVIRNCRCLECPVDFTYIASVNGCYKLQTSNVEWSIAGLQCCSLHKDAHLLVINDAQEQSAVGRWLDSINRQCQRCRFVTYT